MSSNSNDDFKRLIPKEFSFWLEALATYIIECQPININHFAYEFFEENIRLKQAQLRNVPEISYYDRLLDKHVPVVPLTRQNQLMVTSLHSPPSFATHYASPRRMTVCVRESSSKNLIMQQSCPALPSIFEKQQSEFDLFIPPSAGTHFKFRTMMDAATNTPWIVNIVGEISEREFFGTSSFEKKMSTETSEKSVSFMTGLTLDIQQKLHAKSEHQNNNNIVGCSLLDLDNPPQDLLSSNKVSCEYEDKSNTLIESVLCAIKEWIVASDEIRDIMHRCSALRHFMSSNAMSRSKSGAGDQSRIIGKEKVLQPSDSNRDCVSMSNDFTSTIADNCDEPEDIILKLNPKYGFKSDIKRDDNNPKWPDSTQISVNSMSDYKFQQNENLVEENVLNADQKFNEYSQNVNIGVITKTDGKLDKYSDYRNNFTKLETIMEENEVLSSEHKGNNLNNEIDDKVTYKENSLGVFSDGTNDKRAIPDEQKNLDFKDINLNSLLTWGSCWTKQNTYNGNLLQKNPGSNYEVLKGNYKNLFSSIYKTKTTTEDTSQDLANKRTSGAQAMKKFNDDASRREYAAKCEELFIERCLKNGIAVSCHSCRKNNDEIVNIHRDNRNVEECRKVHNESSDVCKGNISSKYNDTPLSVFPLNDISDVNCFIKNSSCMSNGLDNDIEACKFIDNVASDVLTNIIDEVARNILFSVDKTELDSSSVDEGGSVHMSSFVLNASDERIVENQSETDRFYLIDQNNVANDDRMKLCKHNANTSCRKTYSNTLNIPTIPLDDGSFKKDSNIKENLVYCPEYSLNSVDPNSIETLNENCHCGIVSYDYCAGIHIKVQEYD